jgi:hypothetical protein
MLVGTGPRAGQPTQDPNVKQHAERPIRRSTTFSIYPDSGHASLFQYPELFLSHARIFLD